MIKKIKDTIYRALKWSEKYTKTDMKYLARGGFWLTASQFMTSTSAFVLSLAFTNLISPEKYGLYKYILSLGALFGAFTLTGLDLALIRASSSKGLKILKSAFKLNYKWSIPFILGMISLSVYYFFQRNYTIASAILLIALFQPLQDSSFVYDSILRGLKDFKNSARYSAIKTFAITLLLFLTLLITKNISIIILIYYAGGSLITYLFYVILNKKNAQNIEEKEVDASTIKLSKHLSLLNLANILIEQIDKVVVFHFFGAVQLATYSLAIALPGQITTLLKKIPELALPKFSTKTTKEVGESFFKHSKTIIFFMIPVVIIYIIASPFLFKLLFPQYIGAIFLSQIYAPILLVSGNLLTPALTANQAIREQYFLSIVSSIIRLVLLSSLTYFFGIIGLILSRVITKYISYFLGLWLINKKVERAAD